jgi:hypothetical protein
MVESNDPTRAVFEVLDDLRDAVNDRDGLGVGVVMLGTDSVDLGPFWSRLEAALRDSVDIMTSPHPGQGLASIWLNAVRQRAVHVEQAAEKLPNGVTELLWHGDDHLHWLVADGWQSGSRVLAFTARRSRGIRSLVVDEVRPFERLRKLAAEQAADERNESVGSREVGELILQVVNDLDVHDRWFKDVEFREHIVKNIDFLPAIVGGPILKVESGEGLLDLVQRIETGSSDAAIAAESSRQPAKPEIDIEHLARVTESLDQDNDNWVNNRKAAKLEGIHTETLGKYRREGQSTTDNKFGLDFYGRIWRRPGPNSHPWYLRRSLLNET